MDNKLTREQSLVRLHCLSRLTKLRDKLENTEWGINVEKEVALLIETQVSLSLMLHNLGIDCYVVDDLEIAEQLDSLKGCARHRFGDVVHIIKGKRT